MPDSLTRLVLLATLSSCTAGCGYPGPNFERYSRIGEPATERAVLHASYALVDPWGIFPASAHFVVTEVDAQAWSDAERWGVDNRIPLQPGFHWLRFEADYLLGSPFWVAFELQAQPGHQYEVMGTLGCQISFHHDYVQQYTVTVADIVDGARVQTFELQGICSRSNHSRTCQIDRDCSEDLNCVVVGETGFGLCGHPCKKLIKKLQNRTVR